MTLQEQVDCLPPDGGKIILPAADFRAEPPLCLNRDCIIIEGQGEATKLPPVKGAGATRVQNLVLRDLVIDPSLNPDYASGYAIDFRNVSAVRIDNVFTRRCTYGLVLDYTAYYALVTGLFVDATVCAVEAFGGANQNTFIGGRWTAPLGLNVTGSNGITVVGTSIEGPTLVNFVKGDSVANGIKFVNVRNEKPGYGPVWLNN